MESALIEYLRFDEQDEGMLMGGKKYILAHKDLRVNEVTTPVKQRDLLKQLTKYLRYGKDEPSPEEKWNAIADLSDKIKSMFIELDKFEYRDCQLDVVLNAAELGLIPFELMLNKENKPYFADKANRLVLTRRQRLSSFENNFVWPYSPRLLFVYSSAGKAVVPARDHLFHIKNALKKWGNIDDPGILTVLEEPTFEEFVKVLKNRDKPGIFFTHVHILAHGGLILNEDEPYTFEFGIVFGKAGAIPTPTESIKELWNGIINKPFLVNYMICDGANFSNPMTSDKNPVQVTHKAGIPLVLGSQFPLSMDGSVLITKQLYPALFRGIDIRNILYDIRIALFDLGPSIHDWISLVSYIRLPEGYNDYLFLASLKLLTTELRYIRNQTEEYLNKKNINEDAFLNNRGQLQHCISFLEDKMKQIKGNRKYEREELENLGLLGSANKRMAELYFIKMKISGQKTDDEINEQRNFLIKALGYYKQACDKNLSHHWSLVQYLSLDIVLNGEVTFPDYMYVAKKSIDIAIENNPDSWCYGSLLEWHFLQKTSVPKIRDEVFDIVIELVKKAKQEKDSYPVESAFNQINRYVTWWTREYSFAIATNILLADATLINKILEKLRLGKKDVDKAIIIENGS